MHFLREDRPRIFGAPESAAVLQELLTAHDWDVERRGRALTLLEPGSRAGLVIRLPEVHRLPDGLDPEAWLRSLEEVPRSLVLVLLRAGAASMGYWLEGELIQHKVVKKYVTRGRGKAQPGYLRAKGKSRAGSRLRLRNARALLTEVNERLHVWWSDHGAPQRLFLAAPVRLRGELERAAPGIPLPEETRVTTVGQNVGEPGHEELLRVHHRLTHGRIDPYEAPQ